MKTLIIVIITLGFYNLVLPQNDNILLIETYTDSIDNVLNSPEGLPGNIFCNTMKMLSNKRAIGMQDTKISFYFEQKEDSLYEDGNSIQFIPRYNPPIKILVLYNIAARPVSIAYYFDITGILIYFDYKYSVDDEYKENKFWFYSGLLQRVEKFEANNKKPVYEKSEFFSKNDYEDAKKILFNSGMYVNQFYKLFEIEKLDK